MFKLLTAPDIFFLQNWDIPNFNWSHQKYQQYLQKQKIYGWFVGDVLKSFIIADGVAPEIEILLLATNPHSRRQGYATVLLKHFFSLCQIENREDVFLEVEESNTAAIKLYTTLGFISYNRRIGYYGPNRNALLLRKSSWN
jgi:ribosomal-protein-alanine N-acetyltransferase